VARKVRPLLDDLVFVGGCSTGLLITDPSTPSVRPTFDVDAIAELTTYAEYMLRSRALTGTWILRRHLRRCTSMSLDPRWPGSGCYAVRCQSAWVFKPLVR